MERAHVQFTQSPPGVPSYTTIAQYPIHVDIDIEGVKVQALP